MASLLLPVFSHGPPVEVRKRHEHNHAASGLECVSPAVERSKLGAQGRQLTLEHPICLRDVLRARHEYPGCGQAPGRRPRNVRCNETGRRLAVHVFGAEGIHAHACDRARIDSARKSKTTPRPPMPSTNSFRPATQVVYCCSGSVARTSFHVFESLAQGCF